MIVDDDAEFEAALLQLDEIGENWVDLPKTSENKQSTSPNTKSPKSPVKKNSIPEKNKNGQSSKAEKVRTMNRLSITCVLVFRLFI